MTRRLAAVRAAWGAVLLLTPATVLTRTSRTPPTAAAGTVLRLLGARQMVQAGVSLRWRTPVAAALAAATDGLHAATALAFSLASPRWRRAALADAVVAAAFAAAGCAVKPADDG